MNTNLFFYRNTQLITLSLVTFFLVLLFSNFHAMAATVMMSEVTAHGKNTAKSGESKTSKKGCNKYGTEKVQTSNDGDSPTYAAKNAREVCYEAFDKEAKSKSSTNKKTATATTAAKISSSTPTMSKDTGTRLINEYAKDCKAYYTEKDEAQDKFNDRCKVVRDDLIAKAGCKLNQSKAATSKQISDCKKTVSKLKAAPSTTAAPNVDMSDLEGIDIKPVEDVGVKSDQGTIDSIVNIVFSLAGGLSLLFTVIGGLRFVLSRGDPQGTAQAKNTIIFALVGLIVTFFAFTIVKFAVNSVF